PTRPRPLLPRSTASWLFLSLQVSVHCPIDDRSAGLYLNIHTLLPEPLQAIASSFEIDDDRSRREVRMVAANLADEGGLWMSIHREQQRLSRHRHAIREPRGRMLQLGAFSWLGRVGEHDETRSRRRQSVQQIRFFELQLVEGLRSHERA